MCLRHQAVLFGTGRWAVTLFGWEGNPGPAESNGSLLPGGWLKSHLWAD